MGSLQIEELRDVEEFAGLAGEWAALQEASGQRSIFLSHAWFLVCARHLPDQTTLRIVLMREGGRLVGAAPLAVRRTKVRGLPLVELGFLENDLSPLCDVLLDSPARAGALVEHLARTGGYHRLSLARVRADSPHRAALRAACEPCVDRVSAVCAILPLDGTWEEFHGGKSKNFRKKRRKNRNKVDRLGEWSVACARTTEESAAALEEMLAVSARGRKRLEGRDLLGEQFERGFFADLTGVAAAEGWLNLWRLKLGDRPIAAEYHLVDGDTIYGLRAQFDQEFHEASPGTLLDTEIVQHAFESGCAAYDMGPGVVAYKEDWTDGRYEVHTIERYAHGLYPGLVRRLTESWIPAAKRLLGRPDPTA